MLPKSKAEQSAASPQYVSQEKFGSLNDCMVEGDAEQRVHERRIRRWSLALSIGLQSVLLAVLVIAPLFGKTEKISYIFTPLPPYVHQPRAHRESVNHRPQVQKPACSFCAPTRIPPTIVTRTSPQDNNPPDDSTIPYTGPAILGAIPFDDSRVQPQRPTEHENNPPRRLVIGHMQPAMLTRRIEPIYPPLAIQVHRAGRVELHAIIATDGSIQSLEVVEGDPLFVQSALNAVSRWHYWPTMLNGQAVEVDTHITVIYSMQ